MKHTLILDDAQLTKILQTIDKPDWLGIFSQLLIAIIAALSGYYFQKLFKRREDIAKRREAILGFNGSVSYLGALTEIVIMHMDQLVLPTFVTERALYMQLDQSMKGGTTVQGMTTSFLSISALEAPDVEKIITKIPDSGDHPDLILALHRLRNAMLQFGLICDERSFLIKQLLSNSPNPINNDVIMLRFGEILDRTSKLVMSGEVIVNTILHIGRTLVPIAEQMKVDYKIMANEDIKAAKIVENHLYDETEKSLTDTISVSKID
jgi:hypothetical protein